LHFITANLRGFQLRLGGLRWPAIGSQRVHTNATNESQTAAKQTITASRNVWVPWWVAIPASRSDSRKCESEWTADAHNIQLCSSRNKRGYNAQPRSPCQRLRCPTRNSGVVWTLQTGLISGNWAHSHTVLQWSHNSTEAWYVRS
jgi:hypothetical protein